MLSLYILFENFLRSQNYKISITLLLISYVLERVASIRVQKYAKNALIVYFIDVFFGLVRSIIYPHKKNREKIPYSLLANRICVIHLLILISVSPKNEESSDMVLIVKLCCPLSHLVTSLGRLPNTCANCNLSFYCILRYQYSMFLFSVYSFGHVCFFPI